MQTGRVVFFENNVFLTCSFAGGAASMGCVFRFQVNQNGTGTETFVVLQSMRSQQCNVTANQLNGYTDISVFDMRADGVGQLAIAVDTETVGSEDEFTTTTGCTVPQGKQVVLRPCTKPCCYATLCRCGGGARQQGSVHSSTYSGGVVSNCCGGSSGGGLVSLSQALHSKLAMCNVFAVRVLAGKTLINIPYNRRNPSCSLNQTHQTHSSWTFLVTTTNSCR